MLNLCLKFCYIFIFDKIRLKNMATDCMLRTCINVPVYFHFSGPN